MIEHIVNDLFYIYYLIIIIRIFLTWIPTIDWDAQPMKLMHDITDPYLNFFRAFIPPFGGLDFSPIIALLVLNILQSIMNVLL